MTTALEGGEGSASCPGRSLLPGKTRYSLYRRLRGPQGRSGQVWKITTPPGFDPRTVQPVAGRYTDYATRPTTFQTNVIYVMTSHRQSLPVKCWYLSMYQSTKYCNTETHNLDVYSCGNLKFYIKIQLLTSQNKEQRKRCIKQLKSDPLTATQMWL